MGNGFVYILLNPAFPNTIKIGKTNRSSESRAKELSRATGVPSDFIVLFDVLVSDNTEVERLLHAKFSDYRVQSRKEFFSIPPKLAIETLRETANHFPVLISPSNFVSDIYPHLQKNFGQYLDPHIVGIHLITMPNICYLKIDRLLPNSTEILSRDEELPMALSTPNVATQADHEQNEREIYSLDEYSWIMVADIFKKESALAIADDWEKPEGKLAQLHANIKLT